LHVSDAWLIQKWLAEASFGKKRAIEDVILIIYFLYLLVDIVLLM